MDMNFQILTARPSLKTKLAKDLHGGFGGESYKLFKWCISTKWLDFISN